MFVVLRALIMVLSNLLHLFDIHKSAFQIIALILQHGNFKRFTSITVAAYEKWSCLMLKITYNLAHRFQVGFHKHLDELSFYQLLFASHKFNVLNRNSLILSAISLIFY